MLKIIRRGTPHSRSNLYASRSERISPNSPTWRLRCSCGRTLLGSRARIQHEQNRHALSGR